MLTINTNSLQSWIARALLANTSFHRERKALWEELTMFIRTGGEFTLPFEIFNSMKSFLTAKQEQYSDTKAYAFDTAIEQLLQMMPSHKPASKLPDTRGLPERLETEKVDEEEASEEED